jgi:hypothetical protein
MAEVFGTQGFTPLTPPNPLEQEEEEKKKDLAPPPGFESFASDQKEPTVQLPEEQTETPPGFERVENSESLAKKYQAEEEFQNMIASSSDPMGEETKIKAATMIAQAMGLPAHEVYQDYDQWMGKWGLGGVDPKNAFQTIGDSFKSGKINFDMGMLAFDALVKGDAPEVWAEIEALKKDSSNAGLAGASGGN